jgi:large subunit ribosomal protein L15
MKYHELNVTANKKSNRIGRGIAAGQGKTAGRGTKGQKARAGSSKKPGFEGGSNPLMQRIPKLPGFKSHRPVTTTIYTGQLDNFKLKIINNTTLLEVGVIESIYSKVKLIVKGEVSGTYNIELSSASKGAIELVEKAGGKFTYAVYTPAEPKSKDKKD